MFLIKYQIFVTIPYLWILFSDLVYVVVVAPLKSCIRDQSYRIIFVIHRQRPCRLPSSVWYPIVAFILFIFIPYL